MEDSINKVKISVIMPVYNAERYLDECLDSILNQTLREIEVFCIDDGSTDGSRRILEERAKADPRVIVLETPHLGAYKARREGYNRVSGEFLYFMDADDTILPHAFAQCYRLACENRLDHIVFSANVFADADDRGSHVRKYLDKFRERYEIPRVICDQISSGPELFEKFQQYGCYFPSPPLRLIRTSILKNNVFGFPEAPYHGDNYFTTVSLYYANRAIVIGEKLYNRRIRTDSMTTSTGRERIQFSSTFNVILELMEFEPFVSRLKAGGEAEMVYLRKLIGSLSRWSKALDAGGRGEAFGAVANAKDAGFRDFLFYCFVPVISSRAHRVSLLSRMMRKVRRLMGAGRK